MEQMIKTHHGYNDDTVNREIRQMITEGWVVKQFEYSSQIINDKVRSCIILLYERADSPCVGRH